MHKTETQHDRHLHEVVRKLGLVGYSIPIGLIDIAIFGTNASEKSRTAFPEHHGNKELEYLGDRVLKLVHGEWIAEDLLKRRVSNISRVQQDLEMNATFRTHLHEMGDVCNNIVNPDSKACANIFEAVVGSLYTAYRDKQDNAIDIVKQWLETTPQKQTRRRHWVGAAE